MWVLLWVILSPAGAVSSGSAEFEDKTACEAAAMNVEMLASTAAPAGSRSATVKAHCSPRRSR